MGKWAGLLGVCVLIAAAQAQEIAAPNSSVGQTITLPDERMAVAQAIPPESPPPEPTPLQILAERSAGYGSAPYVIRTDRWSETDEREFSAFIAELGESDCSTVNKCLRDPRNPYRSSDPAVITFQADCADLPYYLRFYFAWKRGLPFSFAVAMEPRGRTRDMRYSAAGNRVAARLTPTGFNGYAILDLLSDTISSATYRIHPELESPEQQDFYSPALTQQAIHPGTVIYDPNGHLAIIWKVERNGRIHYLDAHPDHSITRGYYDVRFVRSSPGMGAGFKNWRPQVLVGAKRQSDGSLTGGTIELTPNKELRDFSVEQFFGNGPRPESDRAWNTGRFRLNNEPVSYYDYVRGQLAGGTLLFDPVREIGDMVDSNCADLHYRVQAVDMAVAAGLHKRGQPDRLPPNIYGTEGDWEMYSTPSRDARLKTAFKETLDSTKRFLWLAQNKDPKLSYKGQNLANDLLIAYDTHAAQCQVSYLRSNGSKVSFGYEEARRRLFDMSFDPYHCPERRWGGKGQELATCPDGTTKASWYAAEKYLRNQIDRTYDARMDFGLTELNGLGPGKGVATPPETDVRSWLVREAALQAAKLGQQAPKKPAAKKPWWKIF